MLTSSSAQNVLSGIKRHFYRLEFYAGEDGVGKVMEFYAADRKDAFDRIKSDHARRLVDIWEDGTFVCQVRHGKHKLHLVRTTLSDLIERGSLGRPGAGHERSLDDR